MVLCGLSAFCGLKSEVRGEGEVAGIADDFTFIILYYLHMITKVKSWPNFDRHFFCTAPQSPSITAPPTSERLGGFLRHSPNANTTFRLFSTALLNPEQRKHFHRLSIHNLIIHYYQHDISSNSSAKDSSNDSHRLASWNHMSSR